MVRHHPAANWVLAIKNRVATTYSVPVHVAAWTNAVMMTCRFDTLRAEGFKGDTVTYSTLIKIAMKV